MEKLASRKGREAEAGGGELREKEAAAAFPKPEVGRRPAEESESPPPSFFFLGTDSGAVARI